MDIVCPSCGVPNPEVARFCMACGSEMRARTCGACGEIVPPTARFCPACGMAVGASEEPTAPSEERRIVTVLFADIVGFTSRSDGADPEDVRRMLLPFHGRLKDDIERFGGTLDKFIGDAVMGVFGAPVAHEDDAERAVGAALRALDTIAELNETDPALGINVRIGINTGEAMVSFASGPVVGENVAGDVVNTASRLQGVAPPGGIVIGESTYRATRGRFEFEELEPVSVKNKAEPLRIWRVVRSLGEAEVSVPQGAFVGRERELAFLEHTYDRALLQGDLRLVSIVGEPGIGKSRLVDELKARLAARPGQPTWLRGRCLPYGEGITFQPLRDIVRQHVAISDADAPDEVIQRLTSTLEGLGTEPAEREWLLARIGPLVGVGPGDGVESVAREEAFGAWSRFLELVASRPLVLVFDDLAWADPALLDFLQHATDRLTGSPVLLLALTRPELYEQRPDWGSRAEAETLTLARLSDEETDALLGGLLAPVGLGEETLGALRAGAAGNPLFALEFVRMLAESGATGGADVSVPDSLHGLVAARLDGLPPTSRALLHDAAVLGDRFWPGALAVMGGMPQATAVEALVELAQRGLVAPVRDPSIPDQAEYTFSSGMVRDVAYRQVPRSARARKHLAAGEWLERTLGERADERAELLAFHLSAAVELTAAAGSELPERVVAAARRSLVVAGDRAMRLDVGQADDFYRRAMELTPPGHPERPEAITKAVRAGRRTGSMSTEDAERLMVEAVEQLRGAGDLRAAGRAMVRRSLQLGMLGESTTARAVLAEAIEILEREPHGVELAHAYAARAEDEMFAGRPGECLEWAGRAIGLLGGIGGSVEVRVMAYQLRGMARCELGDVEGLEDLGEALQISYQLGLGLEAAQSRTYLGEAKWQLEGPTVGLAYHEAAVEMARQRGMTSQAMWALAESVWMLFDVGSWDLLLERADEVSAWDREHGSGYFRALVGPYRARVQLHRGRRDRRSSAHVPDYLRFARQSDDLQVLAPALATFAMARAEADAQADALAAIEELDGLSRERSAAYREAYLPDLVETCVRLRRLDVAERLLEDTEGTQPRQRHCIRSAEAILAAARGDQEIALAAFDEARDAWAAFGCAFERARADLGAGLALRALERADEATERLDAAASAFEELGAAPWVTLARGAP